MEGVKAFLQHLIKKYLVEKSRVEILMVSGRHMWLSCAGLPTTSVTEGDGL